MSFQSFVTQQLASINSALNALSTNAKRIFELPEQTTIVPSSWVHVDNNGTSQKLRIQKIISSIVQTYIDRLIYVGELAIDGNDVTVPEGVQALITNITYFTIEDFTFNIPFSDTGKSRVDIIVMNTSAQLVLISGVETVGVAVRPNIPLNTVLVTQINVTEDSFTAVDGILFKGEFDSIEQLEEAHPTALSGSYALVDDAVYFYSVTNSEWFTNEGGIGGTNTLQEVLDNNHDLENELNFQGTGAGEGNTGSYAVIGFGESSCGNNSGSDVNALGTQAAFNNTGNDINALGDIAAQSNQGNDVNSFGQSSGVDNTGNDVNFLGNEAGYENEGDNVNAMGREAATGNTGDYINALGYGSARNNTGILVNALGNGAAEENEGEAVNALGNGSAYQNTGFHVNAIGDTSANQNTGSNVNAMGPDSASVNTGDNVNVFGNEAGYENEGDEVNGFGGASVQGNTGNAVNGLGRESAAGNSGNGVNALGNQSAESNTGNEVNAMGNGSALENEADHVNAFGYGSAYQNTFKNVNLFGFQATADAENQTVFSKWVSGVTKFLARLSFNNITADRKWELPDASGTIALTSDIIAPSTILSTTITNGDTTHAPDSNSVFVALALKEDVSNKDTNTTLGTSDAAYPSQKAVKTYVDNAVSVATVGLLDDRGNYDASTNLFPSSGGSGSAGAVLKGDLWTVSVAGTLGGVAVTAGDVVRALVDTPGQTSGNWAVTENNIGYVAENTANKSTNVNTDQASNTKYPSVKSVYDWATGLFQTLATFASDVRATVLTGFSAGAGTVSASDSILSAINKIVGNIAANVTAIGLKSDTASPTFTGTVTTPAIVVSSETASRIAILDASKNIKSADTATYPSLTELAYGKGVTSSIQTQLNNRLKIIAKSSTPSSAVTGTLTETQVYAITIPADTFSADDVLDLRDLFVTRISGTSNVTVKVKLSTSNTMPSGTTDQIAILIIATSSIYSRLTRKFNINGGNITGFGFTAQTTPDDMLNITSASSSSTFNPAVTQYLYVSITLGNTGDSATFKGITVTN